MSMSLVNLIQWLQQNPKSTKHGGYLHPIVACMIHYMITFTFVVNVHDKILQSYYPLLSRFNENSPNTSSHAQQIGYFVAIYIAIFYSTRVILADNDLVRKAAIYEYTWMCNTTLCFGAFGLLTNRPMVPMAFCVAVCIDQVLWYVDLIGGILSGFKKFPIGVMKYVFWPETPYTTKFTCTHHLWTIPLMMYASGGILHRYPFGIYLFSASIVVLHVCLSRFFTPHFLYDYSPTKKYDGEADTTKLKKYMNVNLSHELWTDIKFSALQINYDDPPAFKYLIRLIWRWQIFNLAVLFLVLYPISIYLL